MDNQLPELKVNMLGRFSITYGEQPITFKRNSATKAVKLLQILLHSSLVEDRGSTGIPRAQLLDDLFGREELANVGNNLRVTVFRLRKMLIEAGLPEYEYIVKEKGVFYWRSPMKVDLDVARFMELVREGEEEVDETRKMNLWEKACRLYKGELLPMQSGEDWVIMNSVRYKDKYSKILRRLCAYRKEQHEYDTILSRELLYDRETGKERSAVHGIILFKNTSEFHKKEEEEKERLQKAVQEADAESKAKTDFMNRISHDIRTPINGIMGMLEILRKNAHNPEKMEECMDKIQVSADHLLALVNDVLDMNKLETNQIQEENEPFDLEVLMREVAVLINPLLEQNQITHRVHRKNIQHTALKGSPLQLRQIMLNLFSNAVKYNKPQGSVDTGVEELSCDGKTAWYEFRIADTGIGMSGDFVKNQLFEPFTQEQYGARTRYQGTGLGMSIVKGLVEKMGGTIQVESVRGEGTTFTFRLPFTVSETAASETTTVGEDISDLLRDRKILLVEDNEINMEIAQFYLEEAGAKVEKAWNGQEAVALFSQNPAGSFDAILMDVMMPVMDGMEATQRIRDLKREDAASIPIIAMTAQTTADIRETCRKAGMDDYIAKPIREEELAKVIRKSWKVKKV